MLQDWFVAHPQSVGESYFEHQRTALRFSLVLLQAALACFVHAIVPVLFQRTASRRVGELHDRMLRRTVPVARLVPGCPSERFGIEQEHHSHLEGRSRAPAHGGETAPAHAGAHSRR